MSASTRSALSPSQRWSYALPAVAMALPTLPLYVLLPVYYAETTTLGLAEVGTWLMFARLLDVASDAFAARLCDRPLGRAGRKGWLVLGALILAPGLVGLSIPPADAGGLWLLGFSSLLFTGWTLVQVPYTAWLASLGNSNQERLQLSTLREGAGMVGLVLSALWPALGGWLQWSQQQIFFSLCLATLGWGALSLSAMLRLLPSPRPRFERYDWRALFRLAPQRRLLAVWWLNGLANAVAAVLFPLMITHWLGLAETQRGVFLLLYFCAGLAFLPLWRRLARRHSQPRVWCSAMGLAIAAFALLPLLPADPAIYALVVLITGATLGADLALPHSIQAQVVRWEEAQTGRHQPALHYAGASLVIKLSLAVGVGLGPLLLNLTGWEEGATTQRESALVALAVIYAWLPCVVKGMAVSLMWGFNLAGSAAPTTAPQAQTREAHRP
ncbi:MFS transporter [Motiliproteus sp. SC1-56]|uniref:MFS transporter n=1 Tax=Motiliproteus sp. SC1-56 TaxID=2799565 RepID=UPI001A8C40F2|nr:MFS transporter [Motiliproteus sp. SC1-56]